MAALLKVISLVSGLISITKFTQSEMPGNPKLQSDSTVRVAVALNNKAVGFKDAEGSTPMILAFNELGEHIGTSSWEQRGHIPSGSYKDIVIHQWAGPGQQATTLQVCALHDAICVAYISQTWSDGFNRGWLGDMARECPGTRWYYSNIIVGDDGYKPACAWIDENHSYGQPTSAWQIHMQDFVKLDDHKEITDNPGYYCKLPAMLFKNDHNYIFHKLVKDASKAKNKLHRVSTNDYLEVYNILKGSPIDEYTLWTGTEPDDAAKGVERREPTKRNSERRFTHLVTSLHDTHSAQALCESGTSHGPDFVSFKEKIFCDMSTKVHWPLCDEGMGLQSDCYHWDTHNLVTGEMRQPRIYSYVEGWD